MLEALREICATLPESHEEAAWVGTRWRVRRRTFVHVYTVRPGQDTVFGRASELDEPAVVMTFRAQPEEFEALVNGGEPFFRAAWGHDVVGMMVEPDVDWAEVKELLTESYRKFAPAKLARLLL
ncbi:MmcQ/YjbR family DNA-binding protein [Lentzea indica]|uniref:MmcQ/YjbR family DNA-binding protein n=1 Tax=Lentzea indica TaxID=2604800 RepID=UPI001CB6C6A6|nr:MmcQ/YjbR family DNA-binding protein [Lentzea indica]